MTATSAPKATRPVAARSKRDERVSRAAHAATLAADVARTTGHRCRVSGAAGTPETRPRASACLASQLLCRRRMRIHLHSFVLLAPLAACSVGQLNAVSLETPCA